MSDSPSSCTKLMAAVRAMLSCDSAIDLCALATTAASVLERRDRTTGSVSPSRKAKSLTSRWLEKSSSGKNDISNSKESDSFIERDTVVSITVKLGRGSFARSTVCLYRVLSVYDKFYNKWLLTDEKKKWSSTMDEKEKKKYKFVARMIEKDGVEEYDDVSLDGGDHYKPNDVCFVADGSAIIAILGKLESVSL